MENVWYVLGTLGILIPVVFLCRIVWEFLWPFAIARILRIEKKVETFGEWAVITGATDGIGKAYAKILASKGMKICLLSRTRERLDATAAEIQSDSGVEVRGIQFDFSTPNVADYERLELELKGLDVGVLVNNVATSTQDDYPEFYDKFPGGLPAISRMIQTNCSAVSMMTHIILPSMVRKRKGAIVNIGSCAVMFLMPMMSLYVGTKAFVDAFTRALQVEYANSGVIIQTVTPFYVYTKMAQIPSRGFFEPLPFDFARSAIKTIGVQACTAGCPQHGLELFGIRLVPQWLLAQFGFAMMRKKRERLLRESEEKPSESKPLDVSSTKT